MQDGNVEDDEVEDEDEDDNAEDGVEDDKVKGADVEKDDVEEEEENDDVEDDDDVEEEDLSQDRDPHFKCASVRGRNAFGRVTGAIVCGNLQEKCRFLDGFRGRGPHFVRACAVEMQV